MVVAFQSVTAEELLRMPEDGWRYELVNGDLRRMPPPGYLHGLIANRINVRLSHYVETHQLGVVLAAETGFLLRRNPDHVRAADVAFLRRERLEAVVFPRDHYFPGAPDLAVEVLSPSDTYTAVEEKVLAWLQAGAQLVLVADPARRLMVVYRPGVTPEILGSGQILDASPVVPGLQVPLDEVFPEE